jgi:PhzF family phenazine biosynthesis protein
LIVPRPGAEREIAFALYDSFATRRFGGNIGGVVMLQRSISSVLMQRVATELGAPTTGFALVRDPGSVRVRFFTPQREIAACGHVTVAVATALIEQGIWPGDSNGRSAHVRTLAGVVPVDLVTVRERLPKIALTYRPRPGRTSDLPREEIEAALGSKTDRGLPVGVISTGLRHLIVPFSHPDDLAQLTPSHQALVSLGKRWGADTVCAFARARTHVRMRDFCAPIGAVEEPASGTTSAALGSYLTSETGAKPGARIVVRQGIEMGRSSRIEVIVGSDEQGGVARVSGSAWRTASGVVAIR